MSAFRGLERRLGTELHLNSTDLSALQIIGQGHLVTPSQISAELGLSAAAVTFVLERLTEGGHIIRRPHPTDGRSTIVSPSPESLSRVEETFRPVEEQIDLAYGKLTEQERVAVNGFLDQVSQIFDTTTASADARRRRGRRHRNVD